MLFIFYYQCCCGGSEGSEIKNRDAANVNGGEGWGGGVEGSEAVMFLNRLENCIFFSDKK